MITNKPNQPPFLSNYRIWLPVSVITAMWNNVLLSHNLRPQIFVMGQPVQQSDVIKKEERLTVGHFTSFNKS